ncbi:hypothetical protein BT69DRAFT_1319286 [Atractiella rhizophila]|nr:hypothetical protein BT69DRAFT_1319286 [Atractiella rhizophila]
MSDLQMQPQKLEAELEGKKRKRKFNPSTLPKNKACYACRVRKACFSYFSCVLLRNILQIKCDGLQPACSPCLRLASTSEGTHGPDCVYLEKPVSGSGPAAEEEPTFDSVDALEKRLHDFESNLTNYLRQRRVPNEWIIANIPPSPSTSLDAQVDSHQGDSTRTLSELEKILASWTDADFLAVNVSSSETAPSSSYSHARN